MFETVRDASLTDALRGILLIGLLLFMSILIVYVGQALRDFHRKGMARLQAYEESLKPVPAHQSNVILFPSKTRKAG